MIRHRMRMNFRSILGLAVVFAFILSSCSSSKVRGLFIDLPDQDVIHLPPMPYEERVIESGDYLVVHFSARDNEAASFFDKMPAGSSANGQTGYQVDPSGNIEFPILGKVKATGLTANQLKETLTRNVSVYLK